mmetsp:Transcript_7875/g.16739  ORF Transcript_7875/g.16739 Transcript_7875/m.16739 type:complete len:326 (-) Transcript_7875:60-1037(-)
MISKHSTIGIFLQSAFSILLAVFPTENVDAIVISAPETQLKPTSCPMKPSTKSFVKKNNTSKIKKTRFRIRRTQSKDLDAISSMLALESVSPQRNEDRTISRNWNVGVLRLRAKSIFEMQLQHRLRAVEEGRRIISNIYNNMSINESYGEEECLLLSDEETCSILWSDDNFRAKVKSAVFNSQEVSVWHSHNFDLTPNNPAFLNHAMMSVVDLCNGDVVGFCEIAWLPSLCNCEHGEHVGEDISVPRYAPAIANLVTSPSHRRMGIATRVIKFVSKFTSSSKWWFDAPLGLYVHNDNESAMRLYVRNGFEVVGNDDDGMLYMVLR